MKTQRSKVPSAFIVVKDLGAAEVVAVVVVEVEVGLLRTLAELVVTPSRELLPLRSVNDTTRRSIASNVTRKGTVSFNTKR
jgi:hypothetical protein